MQTERRVPHTHQQAKKKTERKSVAVQTFHYCVCIWLYDTAGVVGCNRIEVAKGEASIFRTYPHKRKETRKKQAQSNARETETTTHNGKKKDTHTHTQQRERKRKRDDQKHQTKGITQQNVLLFFEA